MLTWEKLKQKLLMLPDDLCLQKSKMGNLNLWRVFLTKRNFGFYTTTYYKKYVHNLYYSTDNLHNVVWWSTKIKYRLLTTFALLFVFIETKLTENKWSIVVLLRPSAEWDSVLAELIYLFGITIFDTSLS